jgi:hypothetical protein
MGLTAAERETVITGSDADESVTIWTAQRPIITKLKANPAAELLEEGRHEGSSWARFRMPAGLISFRSGKKQLSDSARAALVERGRKLAESRKA